MLAERTFELAALGAVASVGPVTIRRLLSAFGGDPKAVLRADARQLAGIEGVSERRAEFIAAFNGADELKRKIDALLKSGVALISHEDEGYPEALRLALGPDAPLVLYIKGSLIPEDKYSIAVVGSRNCSNYGLQVADSIARDLGRAGITVISGLARGIDTVSHKAAIVVGGRTVGVLGCGIDVAYPAENRGLIERMAKADGAVVSEFPPGMPPLKENFPRRNRIISALSLGVLVVEAAERSGALITARFALEQGKEVFAVPGSVISPTSGGTNLLIKDGAHPAGKAEDILFELAPVLRGFIKSDRTCNISLSEDEDGLCKAMSREPKHIDDISRGAGLEPARALGLLLSLELKGAVRQMPGKMFYLT